MYSPNEDAENKGSGDRHRNGLRWRQRSDSASATFCAVRRSQPAITIKSQLQGLGQETSQVLDSLDLQQRLEKIA